MGRRGLARFQFFQPDNTISIPPERKFDRLKILSIAGLLSKAIGYTHSDQSVSSLFD